MKFRLIFILFNAVLVLSFLFIYLMPLVILGWDYTRVFWRNNWFLPIIFFIIIGALNTYFALNWRLFQLLEREDWNGLVVHLEKQVYTRRRLRKQYVRILANGYLVNSRSDDLAKLERYVKERKARLLVELGLLFGIPYLLRNDPQAMEHYFGELLEKGNVPNKNWIEWNHAFALMLLKRQEEAMKRLLDLAQREKDPILLLLTLYLLDAFGEADSEVRQVVDDGRTALTDRFTPVSWQRETERAKDNVEVVILSKLIHEATDWLFSFGVRGNTEIVH